MRDGTGQGMRQWPMASGWPRMAVETCAFDLTGGDTGGQDAVTCWSVGMNGCVLGASVKVGPLSSYSWSAISVGVGRSARSFLESAAHFLWGRLVPVEGSSAWGPKDYSCLLFIFFKLEISW